MNAIIMVSLGGKRAWLEYSSETFRQYAKNIGCDFIIETESPKMPAIEKLPRSEGRTNKVPYAAKAYFVEKYLKQYDRIAIVDDTYCIRVDAESIFDLIPEGYLGFNPEAKKWTEDKPRSHTYSERFLGKNIFGWASTKPYMNSGMIVYDQSHKDIFTLGNIYLNANLFNADFPHQTFTYYLVNKYDCKMKALPAEYHVVPGINTMTYNVRKNISEYDIKSSEMAFHITGSYSKRTELIKNICNEILYHNT